MRDQGYQRPADLSSPWFTERRSSHALVHGSIQESVSMLCSRFFLIIRIRLNLMHRIFGILTEFEFYLKIAIACMLFQQVFYAVLGNAQIDYMNQVILYWITSSLSFYGIGLFIERVIKGNDSLKNKLTARASQVKTQQFPSFTFKGFFLGEIKSIITACVVLYLAPEVHRGNDLILNFGWFLMRIVIADLCFYASHLLFHRKFFLRFHLKHHEFQDTSSFVAAHKSWTEFVVTTVTDLLPVFIFGYDISQLCAWILVGNAYNL